MDRAAATHLITVDGSAVAQPALALDAPEEISFTVRRPESRDVYGIPPALDPHMLRFTARAWAQTPDVKQVVVKNLGGGKLAGCQASSASDWPSVEPSRGGEILSVRVTMPKPNPGLYFATVSVSCPGALNSPQAFRILLDARQDAPPAEVMVDDDDAGFYATPFFWVGHRFKFWRQKGYRDFYRTNGGRTDPTEFVRFTPNLRPGKYEVSFLEQTPFGLYPGTRFRVVVKHRHGTETLWVEPDRTRRLGEFEFDAGTAGYVQLYAAEATGHVLADAVRFKPLR